MLNSFMRQARITYEGAIHHTMNRGYNGLPIFKGDFEKENLIDLSKNHQLHPPFFIVGLLIFLFIFLFSFCGTGRWSEEWEEKYETNQPSHRIMEITELKQGMFVGDIGAGSGRFAVKAAAKVGPAGKVFANDIDPEAVKFMRRRCEREKITNMEVILSKEVDPCFPKGKLDLVYIINTYDHLADPVRLMRNIGLSLKPTGRLAVIVLDPKKLKNHHGHAVSPERVINEAKEAGYELVKMDSSLIYDNIYIFRLINDK